MGCGCSSASAMARNSAYDVARTVSETVRATVLPVRATKYATIECPDNVNYDVISCKLLNSNSKDDNKASYNHSHQFAHTEPKFTDDDSETVSIYYDDRSSSDHDRSTLASLSSEEEFTCIVPDELRQPEATLMKPSPEPIKRFVANPSTVNRQLYHVPVNIPPSITITRTKYIDNPINPNSYHVTYSIPLTPSQFQWPNQSISGYQSCTIHNQCCTIYTHSTIHKTRRGST